MAEHASLVVADIGGTNGRFALASQDPSSGELTLAQLRSYQGGNEEGLTRLVQKYLAEIDTPPKAMCLGMAGPNDGRSGFMVNRDWTVNAAELEEHCGLDEIVLVNDFEALSAGVPFLQSDDYLVLNEGKAGRGPISVVGPGTGLGVGLVLTGGQHNRVISTEAGHMAFTPERMLERELLHYLSPGGEYVAAETILSGPGLVRIHQFLSHRAGEPEQLLTPARITGAALAASDVRCQDVVALFLDCLGSYAGDTALAHGATGGLYLGGGVLPRLTALLPSSAFMSRFVDKGPLRGYLSEIPVKLITADFVALSGAARLYWQR